MLTYLLAGRRQVSLDSRQAVFSLVEKRVFQLQNRSRGLGWYPDTSWPSRWILAPELPLSPDVLAILGGHPGSSSEAHAAIAQNQPWKGCYHGWGYGQIADAR